MKPRRIGIPLANVECEEVPSGRESAQTRVERTAAMQQQKDLVERVVQAGATQKMGNEGYGLILGTADLPRLVDGRGDGSDS